MGQITLNNEVYDIGRMPPMVQIKVAVPITPLLLAALQAYEEVSKKATTSAQEGSPQDSLASIASAALPLAEAFASMPEKTREEVIKTCLIYVRRKSGDGWAKVSTPEGVMMYSDISGGHLLVLTFEVIKENLADFFPVLLGAFFGAGSQ